METSFGEAKRRGSGAGALVANIVANIAANIAMNLLLPSEHLMFEARAAITALYSTSRQFNLLKKAPNAALRVRASACGTNRAPRLLLLF